MRPVRIDLRFEDKGYGITHFIQKIEGDEPLEIIAEGFKKDETQRANEMVVPVWEWICRNSEEIKDYLAQGLAESLEKMRREKKKHVPDDDRDAIREKLSEPNRIAFYKSGSFEMFYWILFGDTRYRAYVTINTGSLAFEGAGILTMGGFKPPVQTKAPDLKAAAALYAHHLDRRDETGLYKHYAALSAKEISAYVDLFCADAAEIDNERLDCLLYLALFSHACGEKLPDKLYRLLLDNEIFYYGEIYLRADEKFADELIAALGTVNDEEKFRLSVSHILCALSAIPCKRVNDFFIESSKEPLPIWARKLHILPKEYAQICGWEAVENGEPGCLIDKEVTAFERCERERTSPQFPLSHLDEDCGFCGQPLALIFNGKRKLATCLHCSCYQTIYMKSDNNKVHWHKANTLGKFFTKHPEYMKNEDDLLEQFEYGARPSKEKRHAFWTANQFAAVTRTQIGGMPTAVNDIDYPKCPDCGKIMRFTAQFDMGDFDYEGIYYFFTCDGCGVTAANYDQS